MCRPKQTTLDFRPWGGERKGAGRKPASARARVGHDRRERLTRHVPVHVTLRLRAGLPSLRLGPTHAALLEALSAGAERFGMRLVHYSAMTNHIHIVCEADDARALSRGMQGVCVRLARALNRVWKRVGKVFADRFHAHHLKSPREVRNALAYVLKNAQHHGLHLPDGLDPFSSALWFDGWKQQRSVGGGHPGAGSCSRTAPNNEREDSTEQPRKAPLAHALSWLATLGWRKRGLLDPLAPLETAAPAKSGKQRGIKLRSARSGT